MLYMVLGLQVLLQPVSLLLQATRLSRILAVLDSLLQQVPSVKSAIEYLDISKLSLQSFLSRHRAVGEDL